MKKKVGVKFQTAGKIYDFDCGAFVLSHGDQVIVETQKGFGFGTVAISPAVYKQNPKAKLLKKVFRVAGPDDLKQRQKNLVKEKQAHAICFKFIKELGLEMNLFSVESTFDASRLTFFFTADGRVDFRQLVKKLVKEFQIRIEMRQVGIRNQAKMCGGVGRCGREFCCSSFMSKFEPISIRMAKQQGVSLNPTKISGQCGRLMCCLTFENEAYIELRKKFPKLGKIIKTKSDSGKVIRHNLLRNRVIIRTNEGREIETGLDEIIHDRKRSQ